MFMVIEYLVLIVGYLSFGYDIITIDSFFGLFLKLFEFLYINITVLIISKLFRFFELLLRVGNLTFIYHILVILIKS